MSASGARHVVLVGLMGTGKSTVGALLAQRLGCPLHDSDSLVEQRAGRTVREIFAADGEDAFRRLEADVFRDTLAAAQPSVIAAAGGVVLSAANRDALGASGAHVVWLRASPEVLAARVSGQPHRPLLDDDPLGALRQMAAARHRLYAEVACTVIDVGDLDPPAIVERVLSELAARR